MAYKKIIKEIRPLKLLFCIIDFTISHQKGSAASCGHCESKFLVRTIAGHAILLLSCHNAFLQDFVNVFTPARNDPANPNDRTDCILLSVLTTHDRVKSADKNDRKYPTKTSLCPDLECTGYF